MCRSSTCLVALCLLVGLVAPVAPSSTLVRLGFMTWNQAKDYDVLFNSAILQTIHSAISGINREGGIYGVPVELVTCDIHPNKQPTVEACAANLTATPYLFAIVMSANDLTFRWTLPYARAANVVLGSPLVNEPYPFERSFFFLQTETEMQLRTLVKMAVNTDLNKRIGVIWDSTLPTGSSYIQFIRQRLGELGSSDVAYLGINSSTRPRMWTRPQWDEYHSFLRTRPQAVIFAAHLTIATADLLVDIMRQSKFRWNSTDPNIKFFVTDSMGFAIAGLNLFLSSIFSPVGRMFVTAGSPFLQDSRYVAARHAFADMLFYQNGSTRFSRHGIGYDHVAMLTWTTVRMLTVALRGIPGQNMTRAALQDHIFNTNFFVVDDLLYGPFSGKCQGVRAQDAIQCECNRGYHVTEVYTYSNLTHTYSVRAARTSSPKTQCTSIHDKAEIPLVYLVAHQNNTEATSMARAMLVGQAAQEATAFTAPMRASFYYVTGANATALTEAIVAAANDKYLSVMLASVVDASSDMGGLPLIDPITAPAKLSAPFKSNVLHLSATLEQEIHTLCLLAARQMRKLAVYARCDEASAVVQVAGLSANTFGLSLAGSITAKADERFSLISSAGADALLALGLAEAADIDAIQSFLSANPASVVFVSFAELSTLYAAFTSQLTVDAQRRVFFATSLPHWNSSRLSPSGYFAGVAASARSPLALRGFVASAAVQKAITYLNGAVTPSNFLQTWYFLSIIVIDGVGLFGPFSNSECTTEKDVRCLTNIGAREIHAARLSDMTVDTHEVSNMSVSFIFSSGRIDYLPLPTDSNSLSTAAIVGITLGTVVLLVFLLMFFCNYTMQRNNSAAPKDASQPFTLCFTDIQNSTSLWAMAPEEMAEALDNHHEIIRRLLNQHGGYEVKSVGDGFMIAFVHVKDAVEFSIALQRTLLAHDWNTPALDECYKEMEVRNVGELGMAALSATLEAEEYKKLWGGLRVRVGIHVGIGGIKRDEVTGGFDYYGTVANVAARTEAAGHGGQILATRDVLTAIKLAGQTVPCTTRTMGEVSLRGVPEPVELFELQAVSGRIFSVKTGELRATTSRSLQDSHVSIPDTLSSDDPFESPLDAYLPQHAGSLQMHLSSNTTRTSDDHFEEMCKRYLFLLLSTAPHDEREDILGKLCKFWRLKVAMPRVATTERHLVNDFHMTALCRKLGPILRVRSHFLASASPRNSLTPASSPTERSFALPTNHIGYALPKPAIQDNFGEVLTDE